VLITCAVCEERWKGPKGFILATIFLYLHTHWDREWYRPFNEFRTILLPVVQKVLSDLETGDLPNFYLDGQAIVLQDSIEVDPELIPRIKAQMSLGKLAAGPWYVLADQMLVSGESLIRNLERGLSSTRQFGEPTLVGYCPDTFGHSQDLPRILAGFSINSAVVWRGVPELNGTPAFWWTSPDGSKVLAYHLRQGYYQTAFHENKSTVELAEYLSLWLKRSDPGTASVFDEVITGGLYPLGADHVSSPARFSQCLKAVEKCLQECNGSLTHLVPILLGDFFQTWQDALSSANINLSTIYGELRDNRQSKRTGRAYLLPGVLSTRLYLKRLNRLTERRLVGVAEPLYTILNLRNGVTYPHQELKHAWSFLLQNQPHDSICGCSTDDVHEEMVVRYKNVQQILDALWWRAIPAIAAAETKEPHQDLCAKNTIAVNDPAFNPNSVVVFNLSGQILSQPVRMTWVKESNGPKLKKDNIQIISCKLSKELFTQMGLTPYYKEVDLVDGWVWAESIPALGFKETYWPLKRKSQMPPLVKISNKVLSNGLLQVRLEDREVIVELLQEEKIIKSYRLGHYLQDVADAGDTYNFDPLMDDQPIKASIQSVRSGQKGPLVGSLLVSYDLNIPENIKVDSLDLVRSTRTIKHRITTEITLKRGSHIIFFKTFWENKSRDHRLEVVFNTGQEITHTYAENHFSLVERNNLKEASKLPVEDGCEALPDRFPCQRFFIANDQIFFNTGLPEYGMENDSVSITLLRSVSMISRDQLRTRGGGAGPSLAVPGANCLRGNITEYGWAPLLDNKAGDQNLSNETRAEAYRLTQEYEGHLVAVLVRRDKDLKEHCLFKIDNPHLQVVACYTDSKYVWLRLLNVTDQEEIAQVDLGFNFTSASVCQLDGLVKENLAIKKSTAGQEPSVKFVALYLKPFELQTLSFSFV